MNGEMTFDDYEEMFYTFAKPLKIHRPLIPMPYRSEAEMKKSPEVAWEGAWLSFRQRVLGDYTSRHYFRDFVGGMGVGIFLAWIYVQAHRQYRIDMKLFYLEAGSLDLEAESLLRRRLLEESALVPTLAGIGLLVLMLVATVLIGYCLQVGRRGSPELRKMEIEEEVGACFDVNDKQLDPMASLASLSTRPSSSCSRPNSAWSASRPQMRH
eukprot:g3072.t1